MEPTQINNDFKLWTSEVPLHQEKSKMFRCIHALSYLPLSVFFNPHSAHTISCYSYGYLENEILIGRSASSVPALFWDETREIIAPSWWVSAFHSTIVFVLCLHVVTALASRAVTRSHQRVRPAPRLWFVYTHNWDSVVGTLKVNACKHVIFDR